MLLFLWFVGVVFFVFSLMGPEASRFRFRVFIRDFMGGLKMIL